MNSTISALAWTLIHFLWEGSLIAALLAIALRFARTSHLRYVISCAALVLMLVSAAATLLWLRDSRIPSPQFSASQSEAAVPAVFSAPPPAAPRNQFGAYLPWLVYLWIGGVLTLSLRTGAGFIVAQRLKRRHSSPLPPVWEERFRRLTQRLEIARTVRACASAIAEVPSVVGWLRPAVLVPVAALTGLPPSDVEALLAHELAHIRRNDYLVNLLQTAIETLLFYHPAVWWTSRQIRAERENCCDDLAVAVCGDVLTYARALTRLEQMRFGAPKMAMAANSGSLLARIRRLLRPREAARNSSGDWITGVAILLSVTAIYAAGYVPLARSPQHLPPAVVLAAAQKPDPTGPQVETHIDLIDQDSDNSDFLALQQRARALQKLSVEDQVQALRRAGELDQAARKIALLEAQAVEAQEPAAPSTGFLDGLAAEGYKSLSVDDLISFKIHGVTPDFIRRVKAAGFQPTPDELVSMRIHGVDPTQIAGYKAAGIDKLSIDDLVSFRIHGATPEFVNAIRAAGYSKLEADDIISLRIHDVTPEFAKEVKALGLGTPTLDDLVSMRIHGVTPAFIREAQKRGFKDLTIDKVIQLKQFNIF